MTNPNLNNKNGKGIIPENAEKVKADEAVNRFNTLKRDYEKAVANGGDTGVELLALSQAIAYSVINKVIDPQRKTAPNRGTVSMTGINPVMTALKRGIASDTALLNNTRQNVNIATGWTINKDGDYIIDVLDKDANAAANDLVQKTLSDGIDLIQEAAAALLEQTRNHADNGGEWLDEVYKAYALAKRVIIKDTESASYKIVETTPIQEAYRAVRRAIINSRAVSVNPRNGYTYLEEYTADGLDTVYRRLGRYADLGGYACNDNDPERLSGSPAGYGNGNGLYTADRQTVADYNDIIVKLALTDRQATIVKLRMQGYGYKAIATYLGVKEDGIKIQLRRLREKCEKIGFTPDMWREMTGQNDD